MNNNLKNIPKQFLKNSSFDNNYNTEIIKKVLIMIIFGF